MSSEFELIHRHFTRPTAHTDLAVGDDAALMRPRPGMQLAVSTDMLVAGTHFFPDTDPHDLGWKTLAVNLSDLAAMGAEPRWAFLGLTLPGADEAWLAAFSAGLFACASRYGVDLAGGDTTRGPLTLSITILGELPAGKAITRAGGHTGDDIWVSGQPGLAALGLAALQHRIDLGPTGREHCIRALQHPTPRVELGLALRGIANAMLDVSDGLLGDLGHILERSDCGAEIDIALLPLAELRATGADEAQARRALLAGGDDYELLFCAPADRRDTVLKIAHEQGIALHRIGRLTGHPRQLMLRETDGRLLYPMLSGYDHFA
ncbi:thiamine-phosphate kinase [Parazoarcus communis]|uniref:Thiamine-monophosphate kinase n=1 Tax=Parazoarcus communis TaxID=41977 RepID=A0A2U8GUK9_9RHOO|nr:thiamine-phosphate kinase [Parazoarcus communis]AWI77271.1 thiamine-phosphate kinase [Parazoarcus communis]